MSTTPAFDANTADSRQIAQWLETALDGYFKDDIGRWAFRPLEQHFGLHDDLADDLCAIYNSLTASAQAHWRSAIRDMVAFHGRDISKREATRVLIDFAVLVRSHEILDVLPGILSGQDDGELLDLAVGATIALASQSEASRTCLERIRTSPVFTPDYVGLILVALCRADPDNWLHHVKKLIAPMRELASRLSPESTALRFYASDILDAISLGRITTTSLAALHALVDLRDDLTTPAVAESTWLFKEWFQGNQPLLGALNTTSGVRITLRSDDSVFTELHGSFDIAALQATSAQTCQNGLCSSESGGVEKR